MRCGEEIGGKKQTFNKEQFGLQYVSKKGLDLIIQGIEEWKQLSRKSILHLFKIITFLMQTSGIRE